MSDSGKMERVKTMTGVTRDMGATAKVTIGTAWYCVKCDRYYTTKEHNCEQKTDGHVPSKGLWRIDGL